MSKLQSLTESLVEMEEQAALDQVNASLATGESAQAILDALSEGMNIVGEKYSCQEYFLADLVFAAEIFKQALEILEPALEASSGERQAVGKIVVGTVEGDLHDIGKNIFVALARNAGFEVNDLGIDVPPATFIEHVKRDGAHILGMSGILTMAVEPMMQTIEALTEAGLRDQVKVILGGLPVDDRWQEAVGSDAYTDDAYEGVKMCMSFMEVA
ncbi:MAG: cobalamin-dependent protein [Anaerolineae bacterium]|jgi:methylmalonyl-CoA mutase cobalamin-binding domain/chain